MMAALFVLHTTAGILVIIRIQHKPCATDVLDAWEKQHVSATLVYEALQGYAFQMEIAVRAKRLGYSIEEVSRKARPGGCAGATKNSQVQMRNCNCRAIQKGHAHTMPVQRSYGTPVFYHCCHVVLLIAVRPLCPVSCRSPLYLWTGCTGLASWAEQRLSCISKDYSPSFLQHSQCSRAGAALCSHNSGKIVNTVLLCCWSPALLFSKSKQCSSCSECVVCTKP